MTDRIPQGWRRLLGLAAAPGRALSSLEPALPWEERLSPELDQTEARVEALLSPLLGPALGQASLERAVARLAVGAGEAGLPVRAAVPDAPAGGSAEAKGRGLREQDGAEGEAGTGLARGIDGEAGADRLVGRCPAPGRASRSCSGRRATGGEGALAQGFHRAAVEVGGGVRDSP
jgi:hypothetical protein